MSSKISPLIVALDFDDAQSMWSLVDRIDPQKCGVKIGSELFTAFGPDLVRQLVARGFRVFLDLKFHDIPNTVAKACKVAAGLGVWMLNVHAAGGIRMMDAARKAIEDYGHERPKLIAVTLLTSFSEVDFSLLGYTGTLPDRVLSMAHCAAEIGLDGVVCSAKEAGLVKKACGRGFWVVTPGIRLDDNFGRNRMMGGNVLDDTNTPQLNRSVGADDQARIVSPEMASRAGSDFLVVGRPITQASDPMYVIEHILAQTSWSMYP